MSSNDLIDPIVRILTSMVSFTSTNNQWSPEIKKRLKSQEMNVYGRTAFIKLLGSKSCMNALYVFFLLNEFSPFCR